MPANIPTCVDHLWINPILGYYMYFLWQKRLEDASTRLCMPQYWCASSVHISGKKGINSMRPLQCHYILIVDVIGVNIEFSTMIVIHISFSIVSPIGYHSWYI